MVINKIRKLEATKAKLADLEKTVARELRAELSGLPAAYGFGSLRDFVEAVREALRGGRRRPGRKAAGRSGRKAAKGRRRRRAVITDATRAGVKKLVEAGKTGGEIAKALKISLPSVQNIKKALGLVKGRK
jgi:DNA-binding NarL/FixJ family response regulator